MNLQKHFELFPVVFLLFCTNIFVVEVLSGKILFLLPIASTSHKNIFDPLIRQLAKGGHEILVMSPISPSEKIENVEEFVPVPLEDIFTNMRDVFEHRKNTGFSKFSVNIDFIINACHRVFEHPKTVELLATKRNYYDVVVLDILGGHNCVYGMVAHLGSPVIAIATSPPQSSMVENLGTNLPSSFIPDSFLPFSDRMSFSERMANSLFQWMMRLLFSQAYIDKEEAVYKQHLGEHTPSITQIQSNFSLLMTNTYFSMNYPKPLLPDIVEIGGIHCRPAKPLQKDLESFLGEATEGFIFFSFGSIVKSKHMPEKYRKAFVNVFASLKQKVLWKWDSEHMDDLPENVKLIKWAPQQDILGHKNIKLFISHGGQLSSQEAVYHGVPVLNIPFFADQDLNSNANFKAGFALNVEIIGMTEEILMANIMELLENPKYLKRAKELSAIFKDQLQTPLDRAVYWTEYIMKFKGAPHLRSSARNLSFVQYHSLDVIACLVVSVLLILCATVVCVQYLIRYCATLCFTSNTISSKKRN